jgi:hypothetical protein
MTALPMTLTPPLPRSLYLETTSRCDSLREACILTVLRGRWSGEPAQHAREPTTS